MPNFHNQICNYEYKLVTPPTETPVTLDEFKKQLKFFSDDDAHLTRLLEAATKVAEKFLNIQLVTQTWALFLSSFNRLHNFPGRHGFHISFFHGGITLKKRPFASLTKVEFYPSDWDEIAARTSFDINNFFISEATEGRDTQIVLFPSKTFPDTFSGVPQIVLIEFTAGQVVADICQDIKQAILIIATFLVTNRGDCSCDGGAGIPAEAKALLFPHRVFPSCC